MSIFKQTFQKHLQNQIIARQNLLATPDKRPISFQQYVSSKSPWVKMTSLVDYNNSTELARKYILAGGTLYPNPENDTEYALRRGLNNKAASYGSNLGDTKQYGIRPMPGITSVSIKSRGAYGSLRDATVKYYAWDLKQLEDLVILFMKPGYPVVLEWGWSMYIYNDDPSNTDYKLTSSDILTVDCFDSLISQESLYEQFEKKNIQYKGNYEGMLGLIKNFEYSLLPNGGFECTTTIVSIGDVIESLKMNVVTGTDVPTTDQQEISPQPNGEQKPAPDVKDDFEKLMDWLSSNQPVRNANPSPQSQFTKETSILKSPSNPEIDTKIVEFGDSYSSFSILPKNDNRNAKYIQLAYLVYILNEKHNLFLTNRKTLVKYELPISGVSSNKGNGLCVASYNSISIDPTVCILKNSNAKLFGDKGFAPYNFSGDLDLKEYLYKDTNLGIIGNLYVNMGAIIDVYKATIAENKGKTSVAKFLRALLNRIEFALGSINSFDIYVENNRGVIIDKHYVEDPTNTSYDSKFELKILGNNSTARNHRVVSRIFQEQSTMVAIAAQDRANIAGFQSSTNAQMNENIYNRLYKNSSESSNQSISDDNSELEKDKNTYLKDTRTLLSYVKEIILPGKKPDSLSVTVQTLNTILNNLLVKLEGGTDYKGIVPLALEVSLDGIGGVTIGEIFRINTEILPSQYSDKAVGFIVTGIDQDITRADWTTKLTAQFCLLDQQKRQAKSKQKSSDFFKSVLYSSEKSKNEIEASAYAYNVLICFLADFFGSKYNLLSLIENNKISQSVLKYKSKADMPYYVRNIVNQFGGNEGEILSEFGKLSLVGANQIKYKVKSLVTSSESLSDFLTNFLFSKYASISDVNVEDYKKNIIDYLDYVVHESSYYKGMLDPYIKKTFDDTFSLVKTFYNNRQSIGESVKNLAFAAIKDVIVAKATPGKLLEQSSTKEALKEEIKKEILVLNYVNKNAYNDYGLIKKEILFLKEGLVLTISDDFYTGQENTNFMKIINNLRSIK